jgi:hypothetical protein
MDSCKEGSMFHFVFWKKHYFTHTTRPPSPDTHLILITETGFIPYRLPMKDIENLSYSHTMNLLPGRSLGQLVGQQADTSHATSYCLKFSYDMKTCVCPLQFDQISTMVDYSGATSKHNIALVTIAWLSDFLDGHLQSLLRSWDDHKIVVLAHNKRIAVDSIPIRIQEQLRDTKLVLVSIDCRYNITGRAGKATRFNTSSFEATSSILPDNTLLNIALDLVTTPMVVIVPPGFRLRSHATVPNLAESISHQLTAKMTPPGSIGMVIPSFHRDHGSNISSSTSYHSFPSSKLSHGRQQSSELRVSFDEAMDFQELPISCHSVEVRIRMSVES